MVNDFWKKDEFTELKNYIKNKEYKKFFKHRYITSLLGIVGALVVTGSLIYFREKVQTQQKITITTNKAEDYFYSANYNAAINEYLNIQRMDNSSNLWNVKIAEVYSVKGDIENSRKYIEKAKNDKKTAELLNYIIFTEFMNKDYKSALADGEKALKDYPHDKKLIKTMFTVYMANNELDKAKSLMNIYPVDSKSSYDMAEYGRMLMIEGDMDNGFKNLKLAWNENKDEYKVYDVLAQISVYNKDKILQLVTDLSDKNKDEVAYKMWLAKIYSLQKETADQAGKILDSIKNKDVGKIEFKLIKASVLQNTDKTKEADELMNSVIKENKDNYTILHTAGWYYLNKKEYDKAEKYCKESIIKNRDYPDNYGFLMPEILKNEGKSIEGEPYFRTAMMKEPYNYNIMLNIANFYWYTTKNTDKAMEYFRFAEIVKPDDADIKYNMALIDLNNKKDDDAIKLLNECIKLADVVPEYHRTLGTVYFLKGNTKEALQQIRYAYNGDENDILTLNNAGCYYITVDANLDRGMFNLKKAYEGINKDTDKYTKDTITDNYNKAKKLYDDYTSGNSKTLKVPDFVMFY
ncbi:MAG: hypothetical protein K0R54_1013 [Clostridiaceae bacterium]|jgi:predicted Zn-dependent protease|nr:hypothetical protein [Clostridiaceae bacterium]